MNQAGSEKKCSKSVSYECVLNNYNYDEVSADQNSICENGKQGGCSASADGKHSSNVGSVCNTEHIVGVAEVCPCEAKSELPPGASNAFEQSLLQKAWIYLQSIINKHKSACPRCNPRPPPDDVSPSESTTQFFQRTRPSAATLTLRSSCCRTRPICSRTISPCHNPRPSRQRAFLPCPRASPPNAKSSKTSANHKSCTDSLSDPPSPKAKLPCPNDLSSKTGTYHKCCIDSLSDPPCPKAKLPCPNAKSSNTGTYHKCCTDSLSYPPSPKAKSPCPNAKSSKTGTYHKCCQYNTRGQSQYSSSDPPCPNAKSSKTSKYHKDCHNSPFDSPSPNATPTRLKAMPPHPNYKSSILRHSVSQDSLSDSSYSNQSVCSNAKPVRPNAKPVCPNAKPVCPNAKPVSPNAKPFCPNAKPVCPNTKPVCPNAKPVCSNPKTCLYHSFSNDSLPSSCKESLVEMAKVYIENITSEHKGKCPLCSKQCSYYSLETITSYLRGMLDQALNYMNKPAEQKSSESSCSNFKNSGILKSKSSKSKCSCAIICASKPKPLSFESEDEPRSITCPTCRTRFACPKATRLNFALYPSKHDDDAHKCGGPTSPDRRSEEEGTHEHKCCYTHGCMHNSKSAQPSFNISNTSGWSPKSYAEPVFNKSLQIKTPQSVEELKASVTGISDKSSGNFYGYEVLDLRSTVEYSRPCVYDSNVSKEFICLTDEPTPKLVLNLTMEQKDVGPRPKESNHSRESLDNCKETISPCCDLEGQTSKEEAQCPNQSCSEGSRKSEANVVDVIGEESGSMIRKQLRNKETISKAGHSSMTCIETIQSDRKDSTVQEYNLRRDPHNYRYYY